MFNLEIILNVIGVLNCEVVVCPVSVMAGWFSVGVNVWWQWSEMTRRHSGRYDAASVCGLTLPMVLMLSERGVPPIAGTLFSTSLFCHVVWNAASLGRESATLILSPLSDQPNAELTTIPVSTLTTPH